MSLSSDPRGHHVATPRRVTAVGSHRRDRREQPSGRASQRGICALERRFLRATPTGFEGVETQPNADDQLANLLRTLRDVSPSLRFDYPELHDAVRASLQRISQAISRGDVATAARELAAMIEAMDCPKELGAHEPLPTDVQARKTAQEG